ncbi:unnamed protein product [Closterium sp. Naga37s-1]|nr:unnamed protein product [Closterium sp. Naga37s-1]
MPPTLAPPPAPQCSASLASRRRPPPAASRSRLAAPSQPLASPVSSSAAPSAARSVTAHPHGSRRSALRPVPASTARASTRRALTSPVVLDVPSQRASPAACRASAASAADGADVAGRLSAEEREAVGSADVAIITNGPGEVAAWVAPVVASLARLFGPDPRRLRVSVRPFPPTPPAPCAYHARTPASFVLLAPCPHASGNELAVLRAMPGVHRCTGPQGFFHMLLFTRPAAATGGQHTGGERGEGEASGGRTDHQQRHQGEGERGGQGQGEAEGEGEWGWRRRGVVVFLGGEQLNAVLLARRLGYRCLVYAEDAARWPWLVDMSALRSPVLLPAIPPALLAARRARVVGDLFLSAVAQAQGGQEGQGARGAQRGRGDEGRRGEEGRGSRGVGESEESEVVVGLLPGSKVSEHGDFIRREADGGSALLPLRRPCTQHDLLSQVSHHVGKQVTTTRSHHLSVPTHPPPPTSLFTPIHSFLVHPLPPISSPLPPSAPRMRFILPLAPTVQPASLARFASRRHNALIARHAWLPARLLPPAPLGAGGDARPSPPGGGEGVGWEYLGRLVAGEEGGEGGDGGAGEGEEGREGGDGAQEGGGVEVEVWRAFPSYALLSQCSLALTTVGTNTAELAALGVPMVVVLPTLSLEVRPCPCMLAVVQMQRMTWLSMRCTVPPMLLPAMLRLPCLLAAALPSTVTATPHHTFSPLSPMSRPRQLFQGGAGGVLGLLPALLPAGPAAALTCFLNASLLRSLPFLAWPNRWAGREVVPEVVGEVGPGEVAAVAARLLGDAAALETMGKALREVASEYGGGKGSAAGEGEGEGGGSDGGECGEGAADAIADEVLKLLLM